MSVAASPNPIIRPDTGHRRTASVPAARTATAREEYEIMQPTSHFYDAQSEKISNLIDEELKKESQMRRDARKRTIKVMLLGQAESGKSTLQKQFQLFYASKSLDHERPSWTPVVHFNIVKAVRMMLDELDFELARPQEDGDSSERVSETMQQQISALRTRLLPLVAIEDSFATELNGGISVSGGRTGVFVRPGWQAVITSNITRTLGASKKPGVVATMVARTLRSLLSDIDELWKHSTVKRLISSRKLRLDESAPFFLNNIHRISEPDYLPSTDDILNVRLQTLGVIEHTFPINMQGSVFEWRLYDVGGARGQRPAWIPYFDDATAIIFLAPISAFDQYLEEDPRTNRMNDSLQLFTAICSNELLKDSHLVLLLNKTDLLRKKLEGGAEVRKYITSYGNRGNTYEEVSEYFRAHFVQIHRKKDPAHRVLYVHFTSMLDIVATQRIITNVGEAIMRQHIAQIGLV
ncbi:guanine nucleotide binding protein, alpha subunit [Mycena floridula]|nr:guanine nucleotide binding protein, alpha subunit [Mycena floridula]